MAGKKKAVVAKIRVVCCLYCGLTIAEDIVPTEEGVEALRALMTAHDRTCSENPLVARLAAVEHVARAAVKDSVRYRGLFESWKMGHTYFDRTIAASDALPDSLRAELAKEA